MPSLVDLHYIYIQNVTMFPALLRELSGQLGVSITSLSKLEVGFNPDHNTWIFPERDEHGMVIGLLERYMNGKKFMVKGSKRGLIYGINYEQTEEHEKKKWVRVSKDFPCSKCGKSDGCMYPDGEYDQPNALVCVHISDGSIKPLQIGYLHVLDKQLWERRQTGTHSLLLPSSLPILVVEGASDVAAAMDLGFTAIGRPSAEGGLSFLQKLLHGRDTIIVGENDSGAGAKGMESTFVALKPGNKTCVKVLPPEGIKDFRQWKTSGLTQEEFLSYVEKTGICSLDQNVFEDDIAYSIAKDWLRRKKTANGKLLLRIFRQGFIEFNGKCYDEKSNESVHGELYEFLANKSYIHTDSTIRPYKPTRAKLYDILDACNAFCPIDARPPAWLDNGVHPDPSRLITFTNGILDVNDYIKGKITLYNPTPDLFTFTVLPYDFDENLNSKIWEDFLTDIFNGDKDKITLMSQWFGYNSVADLSYEKLMLFTGRPRSGKSTVLEALQAMLGDHNCCETSFQALGGAFGYQPLVGKLSAIIGDAKSPKYGEAESVLEKILHITGGDAVSVNVKNKAALPLVRLNCRFTVAMNDLPAFTDHSRALEYRTNILTFDNSYVGREDRSLKQKFKDEAGAGKLINFALKGLASLYASNNFIVPDESAIALRTFRELVSPITEFVENCLIVSPNDYVASDFLYDLWKWWCGREGRNTGLKNTFTRNILATVTDAAQIRNETGRVIAGIKVTDWAEKEYVKGV